MPLGRIRRLLGGFTPIAALSLLLLISLKLMSDATANSTRFDELYSLLLLINAAGLLILAALIVLNVSRLVHQLRTRAPGARLAGRMVLVFSALAVTPVLVVFYFSVQFLNEGIDNWFDVEIEDALNDALKLSRTAIDNRMAELLRNTEQLATELAGVTEGSLAMHLDEMRERADASEFTLFSPSRGIIASSSAFSTNIIPPTPDDAVVLQVQQSGRYIGLDPVRGANLEMRVVVSLPSDVPGRDTLMLQALHPVAERMNNLALNVQTAYGEYKRLKFLREPLKRSFTLTLSLVLLLSLLSAVWAAFYSARRLTRPIRDLAEGTRAVAEGDYETRLPSAGSHELGHLVNSFNDMTRRLKKARDEAFHSQQEVEEQRTYLEAVLSNMSSGVVTVDGTARVVTGNRAAGAILNVDLSHHMGESLGSIGRLHGHLAPLIEAFERNLADGDYDWREELSLMGPEGRQVLMCRGTPLAGAGEHVIVFDDITALVNAQRDAAWSEVARRLAHEIKNPLTPIRLSAERVQHKFGRHLEGRDRETLGRLTHTIIQQVEAMKEMVDAFSNYARPPRTMPEQVDVNALLGEVLDLYRYNMPKGTLEVDLQGPLPRLEADPGRLRQLFHNLIKNALEAERGDAPIKVRVATTTAESKGAAAVQITIRDNGRGFDAEMLDTAFEPYVTSKNKGSGLGLAIAKKIVEEHGGSIWARNPPTGGACIEMRFPVGDGLHRHGAAAADHPAPQGTVEREIS